MSKRLFIFLTIFMSAAGIGKAAILDLSGAPVSTSGVHGPNNPLFLAEHAFDNDGNTRWASLFNQSPEWVFVDLGGSYNINSVSIDWESAHPMNIQVRTRTDAQGPDNDPLNWTTVADIAGSAGVGGGGAQGGPHGGFDHVFDFTNGTLTTSLASTSNSVNTGVSGRYLMISGSGTAGTDFYFGGSSIWEVDVDADLIPEPSSGLLAMVAAGFLVSRRRRRR